MKEKNNTNIRGTPTDKQKNAGDPNFFTENAQSIFGQTPTCYCFNSLEWLSHPLTPLFFFLKHDMVWSFPRPDKTNAFQVFVV